MRETCSHRFLFSPVDTGGGNSPVTQKDNGRTKAETAAYIEELQKVNEELRQARRAALNLMEDTILSKEALRQSEEKYRTKLEQEVRDRTAELNATKERLKATLDSSFYVIQAFEALRNGQGKIVDFIWVMNNKQAIQQNGEVIGKNLLKQNPGVVSSGLFEKFTQVIETGIPLDLEQFYNYEQFNGWFHITVTKMGDGFVMSTENITEKRTAREEILRLKDEVVQKATDKYLTLFNTMEEGFVVIELMRDETGRCVNYTYCEANPAFEKLVGFTPENVVGKAVLNLFPGLDDWWVETFAEVVDKQQSMRFEHYLKENDRWYEVLAYPIAEEQVAILYNNITERKKAEKALCESEERKAFLLKLSDALRSLADGIRIQETVTHLAMNYFAADRCYYCQIEGDQSIIRRDAFKEGLPSVAGVYPLGGIPILKTVIEAGKPFVVHDVNTTGLVDEPLRQICIQLQVISFINIPVIKNGKPAGVLCIVQSVPRNWKDFEVELAEEVAERTWAAVERAKVEEALRESEAGMRTLIENLPRSAVFIVDANLRYIVAEGEALRNAGCKPADFVGKTVDETVPPDFVAAHVALYKKALNGETFIIEHDEYDYTFITHGAPLRNANGAIYAALAISYDISDRKKAERALQESEARFRTLTDAVPQVIWANDAEGKANYFNQRWYEYSGLNYEKSAGPGWEAIVHPDDAPASVEKWKQALAAGKIFDTEYRLRRHDDAYCWFIGRNVPLKDASGKVIGWFGSATDIEDLKKAEDAVRNTSDRLQLALDAGKLGTYEYDFSTGEYFCTGQHKANFGYAENEQVTFDLLKERIVPEDQVYMETSFDKALDKNTVYATEYRTKLPDNKVRWIKSVGRFLYNEQKLPQKMVGITLDITEQKLFTEELSRLVAERTKELQRSNADLQQFAHVASHDLKEPVRKIKTFNNRIIDDFSNGLPEKVNTYLNKIGSASDRMILMVEGIMNYSKFAHASPSLEQVDLNEIIQQIETDLEVLIEQKNAWVETSKLPCITGDSFLLYQLFYNLILNSLKFSKTDQQSLINISCEGIEQDREKFHKITLSDNGIGFEQGYAEAIFDTFTRLNPADEYEGTGLGLALCKKIVERHHGFISASGKPDKGATFTILLPVE